MKITVNPKTGATPLPPHSEPTPQPVLVDTHCHLDDAGFDNDREVVIDRATAVGVSTIIVPAIDRHSLTRIAQLADDYPIVRACAGLHPLFTERHDKTAWQAVEDRADTGQIIAIGECGLDYTARGNDRRAQQQLFEQHLELARSCRLPLIVHANGAVEDVLQCVKRYPDVTGVIHSFNGSSQQASAFLQRGFLLGFGGAITYPRATRLRQLVASLPAEALLLETDAPFQTGYRHRGKPNQPAWISEVCESIAELRDVTTRELATQTTANAVALFRL